MRQARRAFLGSILTATGSLLAGQLCAQAPGRWWRPFADHGSYCPCKYWTPRVYPVVACCHGVTKFEEPPGAAYHICLKKFHNPDFVDYHVAYSIPGPPAAAAGQSDKATR